MTPQAALHNEVFRTYFFIVLGVLGFAGIVLSLLKWVLKKEIGSIWLTYKSWLIMAPLIFGSVFAGRVAFIVFICLLAALGFKEFARATGLYRDWWTTGAVYLGIVAICVSSLSSRSRSRGSRVPDTARLLLITQPYGSMSARRKSS